MAWPHWECYLRKQYAGGYFVSLLKHHHYTYEGSCSVPTLSTSLKPMVSEPSEKWPLPLNLFSTPNISSIVEILKLAHILPVCRSSTSDSWVPYKRCTSFTNPVTSDYHPWAAIPCQCAKCFSRFEVVSLQDEVDTDLKTKHNRTTKHPGLP